MASWLISTRPNHELINLDVDDFDRLVWQHINRLQLGLATSFTEVSPHD